MKTAKIEYVGLVFQNSKDENEKVLEKVVKTHCYEAKTAYKAMENHGFKNFTVVPLLENDNGESADAFGRFVRKSFNRYMIRNNFAGESRLEMQEKDVEDEIGDATLAAWAAFQMGMNLWDVYLSAWRAIDTSRKGLSRISEIMYNPEFDDHNVIKSPKKVSTYTELDKCLQNAIESAELTQKQKIALSGLMAGESGRRTAEYMEISENATRKHINSGLLKVCRQLHCDTASYYTAIEDVEKARKRLEADMEIFSRCGKKFDARAIADDYAALLDAENHVNTFVLEKNGFYESDLAKAVEKFEKRCKK